MADGYTILNIVPRTRSVVGGTFQRVQEVTFETKPSGLTGIVDVDGEDPSPEAVAAVVAPRAQRIEQTKAL